MDNNKTYKFWIAVLGIFTVLAAVQITFLTIQNRELKKAISFSGSDQRIDPLKPGDKLPSFAAINASDEETKVSYEADYLVFITSTKCPWCEKTLPSWKQIADLAKGKSIRIVGISTDGKGELKKYVKDHDLNFDVMTFPDSGVQASYKAYSTPQTILVKQGGDVEKVWQGLLSETTKKEIIDLIGHYLPEQNGDRSKIATGMK